MKKLLYIVFVSVFLCTSVFVTGYAAGDYLRLNDEADILTDSEETEILARLDQLSDQHQVDLVICTVLSTGKYSAMDYTDNLFEDRGYGIGLDRSCILLMVSIESGEWYITTAGYGITALTDVGIEYIGEQIVPLMSQKKFADAFREYASICDRFINMAHSGNPFDADDLPKEPFPAVRNFIICLIIGMVVAGIKTGKEKAKLVSVRQQKAAKNYTKPGSMNIIGSKDVFLYKTITKQEKEEESGSSSAHTTKSGTKVGGGGGNF